MLTATKNVITPDAVSLAKAQAGTISKWLADHGYGFADDKFFLHIRRFWTVFCDGGDEVSVGNYHTGDFVVGTAVRLLPIRTNKGVQAEWWCYEEDYQQALKAIAERPTYRLVERRGYVKKTRLASPHDAVYNVRWQGKNLPMLRLACGYVRLHDDEYSATYFERLDGDKWVRCNDPR